MSSYSGKAKTIFSTEDPHVVRMHYRDDATAFNAKKCATFEGKGIINHRISTWVMQFLESHGIKTQLIKPLNDRESLVRRVEIIPVEFVVRNIAAGNLCSRLGIKPGERLTPSLIEFYLKNDLLGDPPINEYHINTFHWATPHEIETIKTFLIQINSLLVPWFGRAGLTLVDYKLEFGRYQGEIILADEISPDTCRLWDSETSEVLDKDVFRKDLGELIPAYRKVEERLSTII